ncbi:MAG: type II toxin-antitoxin system PemK/MazF family toxin [bacterium]|nr:type II toxin-antitoxin system PemK/MazF family toxin [bacterium]
MEKEFDKWNQKKKHANVDESRLYTVREIWWCRLGVNIGTEQDGSGENFLRPVIILRGFSSDICLVLPLTTSINRHPLRIPIGKIQDKEASAILSQIRVIDTRRLVEKVGFLDKKIFGVLRKAVRNLF